MSTDERLYKTFRKAYDEKNNRPFEECALAGIKAVFRAEWPTDISPSVWYSRAGTHEPAEAIKNELLRRLAALVGDAPAQEPEQPISAEATPAPAPAPVKRVLAVKAINAFYGEGSTYTDRTIEQMTKAIAAVLPLIEAQACKGRYSLPEMEKAFRSMYGISDGQVANMNWIKFFKRLNPAHAPVDECKGLWKPEDVEKALRNLYSTDLASTRNAITIYAALYACLSPAPVDERVEIMLKAMWPEVAIHSEFLRKKATEALADLDAHAKEQK
jgi:hypothetical protein